jgi:hypothetical protein
VDISVLERCFGGIAPLWLPSNPQSRLIISDLRPRERQFQSKRLARHLGDSILIARWLSTAVAQILSHTAWLRTSASRSDAKGCDSM